MATKPTPKTVAEAVAKSYCDNHPDVEAVFTTDGTLHNVQNFCAVCVEAQRP